MPLYEYRCPHCQSVFEEICSSSSPPPPCPHCQEKNTERQISRFAINGQGDQRESTQHSCHGGCAH